MKTKLYIFLFAALCLVSCRQAEKAVDTQLRTGDLIFVGIPYDYQLVDTSGMDAAIVDATGDSLGVNYIHVAIVEVDGDSVWIVDATAKRGVDRYPIDTFYRDFRLKDGSYPQFDVMRLKESPDCADFIDNAKGYIGRKYDLAFSPDNEEQYCSDLRVSRNTRRLIYLRRGSDEFQGSRRRVPAILGTAFRMAQLTHPAGRDGDKPQRYVERHQPGLCYVVKL